MIGSVKGGVPRSKVKLIAGSGEHVVIVGRTGKAFFIPNRTFQESEHIASWRGVKG
jgi:3-keto-L-gulonate-6-phosphate decarboxylase